MNIKLIYIKIITVVLCIVITMQLFGCSSITAMQNGNSSSKQSSDVILSSSNIDSPGEVTLLVDSSSNISSIGQSSKTVSSSSNRVSSSSKKTSTSSIASSSKKASSSSKKASSVSSKSPSSNVQTATASSFDDSGAYSLYKNNIIATTLPASTSVNTNSNLYKPLTFSETRGIWVAELGIDFPTTTGAVAQKQEILKIIENVKNAGLNTIFFQVRPMADALYKSDVFPWSKYLTGTQGKDPGYDPLAYLIDEAHKSNIAIQAWINPYRVSAKSDYNLLSANNPARLHPEWTITYKDSAKNQDWIWFNPGLPEVRNLITQGVSEIVKNYNIDGIHFDDYFYPYSCSFFEQSGIDDFRRNNVNLLVKQVHDEIKLVNGNTQFGISPFGIWATKDVMPDGTATSGMSSYSALFADSKLWVTNHWVDYICPQVYWGFNQPNKPNYNVIVDWWSDLCSKSGVALYIGHRSDIVTGGVNYWSNGSINQVQYAKSKSAYKGSVYFSYNKLSSMTTKLKEIY